MAASYNDMYWLSQDPAFQHRVQSAFVERCTLVAAEGWTVAFHRERQRFTLQSLASPTALANILAQVAIGVSTDTAVIADATVSGVTAIPNATTAAVQSLLVTDAHIASAISGQFNQFFATPDN